MEGQSLHQITFFIVIVLVSVLSASLLFNSPIAKTANNRITVRYFSGFFIATAFGYLFTLVLPHYSRWFTVFSVNFIFLASVYSLRFGLMWRQGKTVHIWQSAYVIIHLMIFSSSQVLASSLLIESTWFKLANISANGILVLLGCISALNRSSVKSSYGENIARFALVYVLIGFVLLPILYNSFEDMSFYYSVITVLFVVGLFALMGGLQSLLMSDVIDFHYQSSIEDPLTGIFNRRYFFQAVNNLALSTEVEEVNAVILCDVDKFKQFNDEFGHDIGDQILIKFANMLKDTVGEQGVVCRYGGEEFTILLQKYSLPDAVQFAEVIRRHCESLTVNVDGKDVNITASFGVTEVWDLQDIDLALKLADEALLNAKATGRNRVISR